MSYSPRLAYAKFENLLIALLLAFASDVSVISEVLAGIPGTLVILFIVKGELGMPII